MKTSTKIILAVAGLVGAGALIWYFTQKNKSNTSEEKSIGTASSLDEIASPSASKGGQTKTGTSSITAGKGGRVAWSPTVTTITKISRLKNTPLGQKLGLKSLDAATLNNLQIWFDSLTPKEKKLIGYMVYLDEPRIQSGQLPSAIESREGQGSWNQILALTNKMKDISEGEQIASEQASFAFGGFSH